MSPGPRAGCGKSACPDVCIRLHLSSPLPNPTPNPLSLGFRPCCNSWIGITGIDRSAPKEGPHASTWNQPCPPPRPTKRVRPTQPNQLWLGLPAANREGILNALSRVVAAHLPRSPVRREVTHERP